jgi:hypothetical protein
VVHHGPSSAGGFSCLLRDGEATATSLSQNNSEGRVESCARVGGSPRIGSVFMFDGVV